MLCSACGVYALESSSLSLYQELTTKGCMHVNTHVHLKVVCAYYVVFVIAYIIILAYQVVIMHDHIIILKPFMGSQW